jgi:hypothetical protein
MGKQQSKFDASLFEVQETQSKPAPTPTKSSAPVKFDASLFEVSVPSKKKEATVSSGQGNFMGSGYDMKLIEGIVEDAKIAKENAPAPAPAKKKYVPPFVLPALVPVIETVTNFATAVYNVIPEIAQGLARANQASGSMGSGAPSQYLGQQIRGEKYKEDTYKERLQKSNEIVGAIGTLKAARPEGSADVFRYDKEGNKVGMRVPDAAAVGYQFGELVAQQAINFAFPVAGVGLNYLASLEKNYEQSVKDGIPEDRAFAESAVRSGYETVMDRALGAERLLGNAAKKELSDIALQEISKKGLTREVFEKYAKNFTTLFSKQGLKSTAIAAAFEGGDEGLQNGVDVGLQNLFNYYAKQKSVETGTGELLRSRDKISLYDVDDVLSVRTLVGSLNGAVYGSMAGGGGAAVINGRSWNPSIYSSVQNAYDSQGKSGVDFTKTKVAEGINQAFENGKLDEKSKNNALTNLDLIVENVTAFKQKSKADPTTRYMNFYANNLAQRPHVDAMATGLAEILHNPIVPTDDQINQDLESGQTTQLTFDSRENVPRDVASYITESRIDEDGKEVLFGNVPNTIVAAKKQNTESIAALQQEFGTRVADYIKNAPRLNADDIVQLATSMAATEAQKSAIEIEVKSNLEDINKQLTYVNYYKSAAKKISDNNAAVTPEEWNKAVNNIARLHKNINNTVVYDGNEHVLEGLSNDGQQAKLKDVEQMVPSEDVKPKSQIEKEIEIERQRNMRQAEDVQMDEIQTPDYAEQEVDAGDYQKAFKIAQMKASESYSPTEEDAAVEAQYPKLIESYVGQIKKAQEPKRGRGIDATVGLTNNEAIEVDDSFVDSESMTHITPVQKAKIAKQSAVLKSVNPDAKVIIYGSKESMVKGLVNSGFTLEEANDAVAKGNGMWSADDAIVHINMAPDSDIKDTTIPHEIMHEALLSIAKKNPQEFIKMRSQIATVLSAETNKKLNEFAAKYTNLNDAGKAQEFLAELSAMIATDAASFSKPLLYKIADAVREFIVSVGNKLNNKSLVDFANKVFSEQAETSDLIDFFTGYANAIKKGLPLDMTVIEQRAAKAEQGEAESDKIKFSLKESTLDESDIIADAMNQLGGINIDVDVVNQITVKGNLDVATFNDREGIVKKPEVVTLMDFAGKPVMVTISDELTTGTVVNPITGEKIDNLKGGLGFNYSEGNTEYAWAYTDENTAKGVLAVAVSMYKENPEKYPDGIVPVAVVKMGKSAMVSNEAIVRQIIQNFSDKAIPAKNKKEAYKLLKPDIIQQLSVVNARIEKAKAAGEDATPSDKVSSKGYTEILGLLDKAKTFEEVLAGVEGLNISTRPLLIDRFTSGKADLVPAENRMNATTPVAKALMDGLSKADYKRINIGHLVNNITEPSLANVPDKHIIGFVGIDATQSTAIQIDTHPNYPFALKGKGLGILQETVHLGSVMPAAYGNVVSKLLAAENKGKLVTGSTMISAGMPAALNNTVFRNKPLSERDIDVNKTIGYLQLAFPNVQFFTDQETWDTVLASDGTKKYNKDGVDIYGITKDGHVYLNPGLSDLKTPIHEAGHIWTDMLEQNNPSLFAKGASLVEGTPELGAAIKDLGDNSLARKEAIATLIGNKGETIVDAAKKSKFKEWLLSVYKYVKSQFASLNGLTEAQVEDLTLDKFIEGAVRDILSGEKISDKPAGSGKKILLQLDDAANTPSNVSREDNKLSNLKVAELGAELNKRMKITWDDIYVSTKDSMGTLIKKLNENAGGSGKSLAVAQIRLMKGLSGAINEKLREADSEIFGGLNEDGIENVNTFFNALRVIQLDEDTVAEREQRERELTDEFVENSKQKPDDKEAAKIIKQARKAFPLDAKNETAFEAEAKRLYKEFEQNNKRKPAINEISNLRAKARKSFPLDKQNEDNFRQEVARLKKAFEDATKRQPTAKEQEQIKKQALIDVPVKGHGSTIFNGAIVPMNAEVARKMLEEFKKEGSYDALNKRANAYKKFGNQSVKELFDNGLINKTTLDKYQDKFYSYRLTAERLFDYLSPDEQSAFNQITTVRPWKSLSKTGTDKDLIRDARLLMFTSYASTKKAIFKNKARESMYNELIGKGLPYVQIANYERDAFGELKTDKKGFLFKEASRGFTNVTFLSNGSRNAFQLDTKLFNQLEGLNNAYSTPTIKGVEAAFHIDDQINRILTGMATRYNASFFIPNIIIDLSQQVMFTDNWTRKENGSFFKTNIVSAGFRALGNSLKYSYRGDATNALLSEFAQEGGLIDLLSLSTESRQQFIENARQNIVSDAAAYKTKGENKGLVSKAIGYTKQGFQFLNTRTEVGMRLAAYARAKENLLSEFREDYFGKTITEADMARIRALAANEARSYTDFAVKGNALPALNIPYLNAGIQAFGNSVEYSLKENPREFWAKKAPQFIGLNMALGLAAMAIMGDAYDDVDQYTKDKNIIFPLRKKTVVNKQGQTRDQWDYAVFRVNPSLIPLHVATRAGSEYLYREINGMKQPDESTYSEKVDRIINVINMSNPATIPVGASWESTKNNTAELFGKKVWVSMYMAGVGGYDAFRQKEIVSLKDKEGRSIDEGRWNKEVPYIYKFVSSATGAEDNTASGISPIKTQAVLEKVITSPSTNFVIGLGYALTSTAAASIRPPESKDEKGVYTIDAADKLLGVFAKKVVKTTDPDRAFNDAADRYYKKAIQIKESIASEENKIRSQLKDLMAETKSPAEFKNKVESENGYIKTYRKNNKTMLTEIEIDNIARGMSGRDLLGGTVPIEYRTEAQLMSKIAEPLGKAWLAYKFAGTNEAEAKKIMQYSIDLMGAGETVQYALDQYRIIVKSEAKK